MMARTTYLRATTLLIAMAAAAVVAVLAGYGSASAQDDCQGDCEPPPSSPETTTVVETTGPADDTTNTDREATTGAKGPDAALDRALKDLVAMPGGPPGVIAVVQRGKHREIHTSGVANLKNERRMEASDRMRIASTAKAFSGAVALSLVSKGRLSLDDTIGERLPDVPNAWSEVTLGQLLNHTSGLPDFSEDPDFRAAVGASLTQAPPPEELLTYVYDHKPPLLFEPGSEYRYSNSDNIAVALMVEAATGKTYEDQLQKQVYGPLGLKRTSLPAGPKLKKPYIHGYDNDPAEQPPEDYSEIIAAGWAWASGGIVSTPADLNTFIRAYVRGELFDRKTRSQQRKVFEGGGSEPTGPGKNSAGLGVFRYETRCGTVWGHTGNTPGYTQFMAASPNGNRSATVSINTQLTQKVGDPEAFKALRSAEESAVCAALADKG
jgi:D-alanyl-D-alanine carboxypeptidase